MARDKKAPSSKAKAVKPVGAREKRGHDRDKQKYNQRTGDAREVALEGRVLRLKKLIERKAGSGSVESSLTRVQLAEGLCAHANQTPAARMQIKPQLHACLTVYPRLCLQARAGARHRGAGCPLRVPHAQYQGRHQRAPSAGATAAAAGQARRGGGAARHVGRRHGRRDAAEQVAPPVSGVGPGRCGGERGEGGRGRGRVRGGLRGQLACGEPRPPLTPPSSPSPPSLLGA